MAQAARIADADERRSVVQVALRMLGEGASDDEDSEWEFLTNTILSTEELPASSVDVLVGLTQLPHLLVRCLFRLESVPRQRLWRIEGGVPFCWLLVKRSVWWEEASLAFESMRNALAEAGQADADAMALDQVTSVLAEGADSNGGLCTMARDVSLRLQGVRMDQAYMQEKQAVRDSMKSDQIRLRNELDDWPKGYRRDAWSSEIGEPGRKLLRMDEKELGHRQPMFDTPVATAIYAILPVEPTTSAVYQIRHIYFQDPEWFSAAYQATWAQLAAMQDKLGVGSRK